MLILVFPNAKIVGDGDIQFFHVEHKGPNASSVIAFINWKTTASLAGVVKPMRKQTPLISKPKRANHAPIPSNVQIVMVIIKWIQLHVHSGKIDSIRNGSKRNIWRSMKTGSSQAILS